MGFLCAGILGLFGAFALVHRGPSHAERPGVFSLYKNAWSSLGDKIEALRRFDEENEQLRSENAYLKNRLETLEFERQAKLAAAATQNLKSDLAHKTGTSVGRVLTSIKYKLPAHLLPSQLYTLGVTYLKAREDEKVAKIFTALTQNEENESYRTSKNFLIAGIAWYRLDNLAQANISFGEALQKPEDSSSLPYQAQARLWKALVAKKLHQDSQVQYWLKELLEHHPHSAEEEWVIQNREKHASRAH